ncbi:hypothetical protein F5887DRAFT_50779 [Amanita rubescens]|nr:hypothetical protein F5887DRAFT_50779 [Amanita rubescens]
MMSRDSVSSLSEFKARPNMGAMYLGAMGTGILYGCVNVQTYLYLKNYPDDWVLRRRSVMILWFMDTLHMALTIFEVWHYLIESIGDYPALFNMTWSYKLQILIGILLIGTIQIGYAVRLWKLSSNFTRIWAWALTFILLIGYSAVTTFIVKMYSVSTFWEFIQLRWEILLSFTMSTLNDFVLSAGICHVLSLQQTTFAQTKSRIWIIMCYAVISGMLTSICSLASLITAAAMPHSLIFQSIEFLLPNLYMNSYLALLNSRQSGRVQNVSSPSANMMRSADLESRHLINQSEKRVKQSLSNPQ